MYNKTRYPSYLSGVAYLVHRTSAECVLEKSKDLLLFTLEDVNITGFVAQECNIRWLNHPGFYSHSKKYDFDKDIIHNLDYSKCILYTNDLKQCTYDRLKVIERIMMSKSNFQISFVLSDRIILEIYFTAYREDPVYILQLKILLVIITKFN